MPQRCRQMAKERSVRAMVGLREQVLCLLGAAARAVQDPPR